jgi:hypothetical protein
MNNEYVQDYLNSKQNVIKIILINITFAKKE